MSKIGSLKFKYSLLFALISIVTIPVLNHLTKNTVGISFYHWKSEFNPSELEIKKLKECKSDRIYLHLFDVDKRPGNKQAEPKAKLKLLRLIPNYLKIIPVVYITNRTFEKTNSTELKDLAKNISSLSKVILGDYSQQTIEFQIDCDWTLETKQAYFEFLTYLKTHLDDHILTSATIRLHQIKYHIKTGIPPVNRGMLMFYNMGDVKAFSSKNTLYDFETAEPYLEKLSSYPLPLDYALPAFGWKIHYRLGKIKSIVTDLSYEELDKSELFTKINQVYICRKDGLISGNYFLKGDVIKIESIPVALCELAAKQVSKHLNSNDFQVVFYHLGSKELNQYEPTQLKNISTFFN
jgi:hypothetical protein